MSHRVAETISACAPLREPKATQLALLLHLIQYRHLIRATEPEHGASKQVVLHGEADPEAGPEVGGVLSQQTVRQEEAVRVIPPRGGQCDSQMMPGQRASRI